MRSRSPVALYIGLFDSVWRYLSQLLNRESVARIVLNLQLVQLSSATLPFVDACAAALRMILSPLADQSLSCSS